MKYLTCKITDFRWFVGLFMILSASMLSAQERPGLAFREDFTETPAEIPINQSHLSNQSLTLALHGPGKDVIKKSHHDKPLDDPFYVWSGLCEGNWAVSLAPPQRLDLRGQSKIVWRSKQAGFRQLRVILNLTDGSWLVGDVTDGPSVDWRLHAFNIADIRWRSLDIEKVVEGKWVDGPDLSQVVKIGWTDLMPGGGSNACSRLDWIEVYAHASE